MKSNLFLMVSVGLFFMTTGCGDFLKESSLDEVRPSTANELEQVLQGEGYPLDTYFVAYLDLLTDDVESGYTAGKADLLVTGASTFTWQPDMNEEMREGKVRIINVDTWEHYYRRIMGCNVVLDQLGKVVGTEAEKGNLKGQALAMRAYYHFMLVNLYGLPYNTKGVNPSDLPGVPLSVESAVKDEFPSRNSVTQVYEQMEKDLLMAFSLLKQYGTKNPYYKASDLFASMVLSRMYLYMEKWDKAREYADYVVQRRPDLVRMGSLVTGVYSDGRAIYPNNGNVLDISSPELIWGYSQSGEMGVFFPGLMMGVAPAYRASTELLDLYDYDGSRVDNVGDLRFSVYFQIYSLEGISRPYHGVKNKATMSWDPRKGVRVAEAYLNRAECYIHQYMVEKKEEFREAALADLNYLRECRYDTRNVAYVPVEIQDGEELLRFYKEERRRELCFEDHRWFDLRRYGRPELRHVLEVTQGQPVEYVLEAKSPRYALPIARDVLERNPSLIQNSTK